MIIVIDMCMSGWMLVVSVLLLCVISMMLYLLVRFVIICVMCGLCLCVICLMCLSSLILVVVLSDVSGLDGRYRLWFEMFVSDVVVLIFWWLLLVVVIVLVVVVVCVIVLGDRLFEYVNVVWLFVIVCMLMFWLMLKLFDLMMFFLRFYVLLWVVWKYRFV